MVLLSAWLLSACGGGGVERSAGGSRTVVVRVERVSPLVVPRRVEAPGDVLPEARVVIMPEVSGRIRAIHAREGDAIRAGDVLVEIEDRDFRDGVAQAEAGLAAAEAQLVGAQQTFDVVKVQYERMESLRRSDSISQGAFDEVRARYEQARAALRAAEAQVTAARARLRSARSMLADCRILAPFDGFVAERYEDPGAAVQTMPPTAIMLVVQVDPVRVKARLGERDLVKVSPGMPARVLLDAFPGEVFSGEVAMVSPTVDPVSRNGVVEVRLANPGGRIRPGMAARIEVDLGEENYLSVPRSSLLSVLSDRESELFVVGEGDRAERRRVVLAGYHGDRALVVEGVAEGERVVSRGAHGVSDGDQLRVEG